MGRRGSALAGRDANREIATWCSHRADGVLIAGDRRHRARRRGGRRRADRRWPRWTRIASEARCRWCCAVTRRSRGRAASVMTLAFVHRRDRTLTWLGVGNVEGVLLPRDAADACTSEPRRCCAAVWSVIGCRRCAPSRCTLRPHDTLVIATDGIRAGISPTSFVPGEEPQAIADRILAQLSQRHR